MLPSESFQRSIKEYLDCQNQSPFGKWFDTLSVEAKAKIITALTRISFGNVSKVKALALGVCECAINFGPGYRVYFGNDGPYLVILLGGSAKRRQSEHIRQAILHWRDYRSRKKESSIQLRIPAFLL